MSGSGRPRLAEEPEVDPQRHRVLPEGLRWAVGMIGLPIGACLLGVVFANHPMLFSGLRGIQVRHEDPRLINYLLEHGYLWLRGMPSHRELESSLLYYPSPNALAFSDTLLGAAPLYWPWRLAHIPADTSFQSWLMTCFVMNYAVFFIFLRSVFSVGRGPAAMGGFLFAFGAAEGI